MEWGRHFNVDFSAIEIRVLPKYAPIRILNMNQESQSACFLLSLYHLTVYMPRSPPRSEAGSGSKLQKSWRPDDWGRRQVGKLHGAPSWIPVFTVSLVEACCVSGPSLPLGCEIGDRFGVTAVDWRRMAGRMGVIGDLRPFRALPRCVS